MTTTNNACELLTFTDDKLTLKSTKITMNEQGKWDDEKIKWFLADLKAFKKDKLGEIKEWSSNDVLMLEQVRVKCKLQKKHIGSKIIDRHLEISDFAHCSILEHNLYVSAVWIHFQSGMKLNPDSYKQPLKVFVVK